MKREEIKKGISLALYNGLRDTKKQTIILTIVKKAYERYLGGKENTIENIGFSYGNDTEKMLLECVCRLSNEYVYRNEIHEETYRDIINILSDSAHNLKEVNLLYLEIFLLCSGLYELAYKVRETNCKIKISRYERKKRVAYHDVMPLFWAYIEAGRTQEAASVFNRAGRWIHGYLGKEIEFLTSVMKGRIKENLVLHSSEEDRFFEKLIRGKKILILGPAENGTDIERCVAEHDVVISMIYRGNLDVDLKGKTHISYYSNLACRRMENKNEFIKDLDAAVFKGGGYAFQKEEPSLVRFRESYGFKQKHLDASDEIKVSLVYFNRSTPNLLQVILMDILMFQPEKITVVNTNLFLAKKRYNSKYKVEGTTQDTASFRRSFALHNMINMYQLTKFLYDNKIMEVDEGCKEVLELGTGEYVRRMQELER